jgi:hypothetical protein
MSGLSYVAGSSKKLLDEIGESLVDVSQHRPGVARSTA